MDTMNALLRDNSSQTKNTSLLNERLDGLIKLIYSSTFIRDIHTETRW